MPSVGTTRRIADEKPAGEAGAAVVWRLAAGQKLPGGRYVLRRRLGRGGMSTVWLADDTRLERPVAVKILSDNLADDDEYARRFDREARVAARLSHHPNLVSIFDFDAGERPYLVMEYVAGGDLAELIESDKVPDFNCLARDLLAALDAIHAAGVVHRDVKPKNVLLGTDGRARLTDFGIAQPSGATALTRTGMVLGTTNYIAPELLEGREGNERSDLYSLGVTLSHATEGAGADRELRRLIDRLRAQDPTDRPASAAAELRDLEDRVPGLSSRPARDDGSRTTRVLRRSRTGEPTQPLRLAAPVADFSEEPTATSKFDVVTAPRNVLAPVRPVGPKPAAALRTTGGGTRRPPARRRPADDEHSRPRRAIGVMVPAAIAFAVAAIVFGTSGNDLDDQLAATGALEQSAGKKSKNKGNKADPSDEGTSSPSAAVAAGASGAELNNQGYSLIQNGSAAEAVPVLEEAVAKLEASDDITYAYALYNLGWALRLSGQPEQAIPVLEERLEIPNQTGVVRRQLAAARADAGQQ